MYHVRGEDVKAKQDLTPAEKAEQKKLRIVADKERKKKVNAPGRIVKIQASPQGLFSRNCA